MNQFIETVLDKTADSANTRWACFNSILTCEEYLVNIPVKVIE